MKIKPGTCKEERTVLSRNSDRKLATYTKEHHWASSRSSNRNLTKNSPFCTWSSPLPPTPRVLWDGPPVSAQLDTGNVYFILIFPSCSASLLVGIEATPVLWAWMQPRYPGAQALMVLRRQSSHQLVTELSLKANVLSPQVRGGVGAPSRPPEKTGQPCTHRPQRAHPEPALLRALRLETQTEMEPKISMTLLNTRLGNNWLKLIKNHTEWKEHKHKFCNWHHISIKNYKHFRKQQKIYMTSSVVMSSKTQQKSQYTKCFK